MWMTSVHVFRSKRLSPVWNKEIQPEKNKKKNREPAPKWYEMVNVLIANATHEMKRYYCRSVAKKFNNLLEFDLVKLHVQQKHNGSVEIENNPFVVQIRYFFN